MISYLFFVFSTALSSQEVIETSFIKADPLVVDTLFSVDQFGTTYGVKNNVVQKTTLQKTLTYTNLQLGELYTSDAFNPLKIPLFYKDFNTVIILDNRLAEIFRIDFNELSPYRNVSYISTGFDNTLWLFNQDSQRLELFDFKTQMTRAQTAPIKSQVLDIKSNYNYCWLLTTDALYHFNYFGSLIKKIKNDGYSQLTVSTDNIILKKENNLFYLDKKNRNPIPIQTPNLLIDQFFVINETLYIYSKQTIYQLLLKIN